MKPTLLLAFIAVVAHEVLYHLAQKSISATPHPVLSLAFYLLAALLSLPLFWLFPLDTGFGASLSHVSWATVGAAASIVLIELGFLLAYRGGANIQTSYIASALLSTAALVVLRWLCSASS